MHTCFTIVLYFSELYHTFLIFNLFKPSLSSSYFFTDLPLVFTIFDPFIFFTVVEYFSTFFFVALVQTVVLFDCLEYSFYSQF